METKQPRFSQKHYIVIAKVIKNCTPNYLDSKESFTKYYGRKYEQNLIIRELARVFERDSDKFDKIRFTIACTKSLESFKKPEPEPYQAGVGINKTKPY